jgi:hypothetical protein
MAAALQGAAIMRDGVLPAALAAGSVASKKR